MLSIVPGNNTRSFLVARFSLLFPEGYFEEWTRGERCHEHQITRRLQPYLIFLLDRQHFWIPNFTAACSKGWIQQDRGDMTIRENNNLACVKQTLPGRRICRFELSWEGGCHCYTGYLFPRGQWYSSIMFQPPFLPSAGGCQEQYRSLIDLLKTFSRRLIARRNLLPSLDVYSWFQNSGWTRIFLLGLPLLCLVLTNFKEYNLRIFIHIRAQLSCRRRKRKYVYKNGQMLKISSNCQTLQGYICWNSKGREAHYPLC